MPSVEVLVLAKLLLVSNQSRGGLLALVVGGGAEEPAVVGAWDRARDRSVMDSLDGEYGMNLPEGVRRWWFWGVLPRPVDEVVVVVEVVVYVCVEVALSVRGISRFAGRRSD